MDPVRVPQVVKEQLDVVRMSGRANMLDTATVIQLLVETQGYEAVDWLIEDRARYTQMVMYGPIVGE